MKKKIALCFLLVFVCMFVHEDSSKRENLTCYQAVHIDGEPYLTDGSFLYEPLYDDNWFFSGRAQTLVYGDDVQAYGHTRYPIGRMDTGRRVYGFQNDEQRVFIQQDKGFLSDMDTRIWKRKDITLPSIDNANLSVGDAVFLHAMDVELCVGSQRLLDEIAELYQKSGRRDMTWEREADGALHQLGYFVYYYHDFRQCCYRFAILAANKSKSLWIYNEERRLIKIQEDSIVMEAMKEVYRNGIPY